ncbi:MAG: S8 family serine peptidase [Bacteroidota bacterium]
MRKLCAFLLLLSFTSFRTSAQDTGFVPGELMVMLRSNDDVAQLEKDLSLLNSQYTGLKSRQQLSKRLHAWLFSFHTSIDHYQMMNAIAKHPLVILVQSNHYVYDRLTPNDTQFGSMWDMNNTGQTGGTTDADIDAVEAWDITTGGLTVAGDTIVVAVVDNGFSLSHQDLRFWKNYGEIPNNSVDDDGNGYVDDYNGWNAYNNNGTITSSTHGTHVTGTVGARGNNNLGVTGVNWNVKVMPVQGSSGTESTVVLAYDYVLNARALYNSTNGAQGAFVVSTNASFGVDQGQPSAFPLWCAMYDSLGAQGILNAGATANQNWDIDAVGDIPTACPSPFMISVTNTTHNDVRNSGAAYGLTTIDLGAPGTNILSTTPGNNYSNLTGTSMATPHVAGAIALMWAAACQQMIDDYRLYPDSLAEVMKDYLLTGTDPLTNLSGMCVTGGRLNLNGALLNVLSYNCLTTSASSNENEALLHVYPNPALDELQVSCYFARQTSAQIILVNMLGEAVMAQQFEAAAGVNQQKLSTTGLDAGVYFIMIKTTNGLISGGKIVKQ